MKHFIISLLLFPSISHAIDFIFINNTPDVVRIASLSNKCSGYLVKEDKPIYIKSHGKYVIKDVVPIVHTYTICGSGYCSSSAIGVKDSPRYILNIRLDGGVLIDVRSIPDHWKISNFECK